MLTNYVFLEENRFARRNIIQFADANGRSWPLLGRSSEALGPLLAAFGSALGRSWLLLSRSWVALGRSWAALGPVLGAVQGRPLKKPYFLEENRFAKPTHAYFSSFKTP